MSRFEEIETFVQTVNAGSFTAAAGQLGIAKSVVSRRVQELEKRLGVQLMIRSTRQLSLTDEGQVLYDKAIGLLNDWEQTESLVGQQKAALQGTLRLALPVSFGLLKVGPVITSFLKKHPGVSVDIDFSDRKVDLIAEGFDLAVRIDNMPDSSLIARKISPITFCAAASPEYLDTHGNPPSIEELKNHSELRFGLRERKSWQYTDPSGNSGEFELASTIRATNGEFLRDAAIAGHGIVILPRFIAEAALTSGALTEILPDYRWHEMNAYALYPASKHMPLRLRKLIDHLVDCFN